MSFSLRRLNTCREPYLWLSMRGFTLCFFGLFLCPFGAFGGETQVTDREQVKLSQGPETEDKEFTRYKEKLFRAVGARYHAYVQTETKELSVGMVKFKIYVRSDGVIANLEIVEGRYNSDLASIARRSIMDLSGQLEPFSENLRDKLGNGFTEEIRFWIKGNEGDGAPIQHFLKEQSEKRKQGSGQ